MESITKYRQDDATLRAMLGSAFGDDAVPNVAGFAEELGHGWYNVAYRVRLRDGRRIVLKIAPPPGVASMTYEHKAMATEIDTIALIEQQTTVPVPHVRWYDTSHDLIDAEWFAMDEVPGDNLAVVSDDLDTEQYLDLWRQTGALNRQINGIAGTWFGRLGGQQSDTWHAAFAGILDDALTDGERLTVDLGSTSYREVRDLFALHEEVLDQVTEPRLVEWDLWPSNVMVAGGVVTGIIDHERAFWGDPLFEAGFLEAGAEDLHPVGVAFLEGYGRGPLTPDERRRRLLYTLHLGVVSVVETAYRHTTTEQADRCRAWLRSIADDVAAL